MKIAIGFALVVASCGSVTAKTTDGGPGTGGDSTGESNTGGGTEAGASGAAGGKGTSGTAGTSGAGVAGATGTGAAGAGGSLQLGPNLITDGDFLNGQTGWTLTQPAQGTATMAVTNGQLCVTLNGTGGDATTLGWPAAGAQGVQLTKGVTYEFSFQLMSAPALLYLEDKVGSTLPPDYAADFDTMSDGPVSTAQVIAHEFTPAGDPSAGVAFTLNTVNGTSALVCLSNVSLRQVLNAGGAGGVGGTGGTVGAGAAGTSGSVPPFG